MERERVGVLAAIGLTVLCGYEACGADILDDPGFDLWCGDELCSWEVEEGEVEKVPTWHEQDEGASLVGPRVAISQLAEVTNLDVRCVYFTLLADADPGATLSLELDFLDDGVTEYDHEIPAEDWENIGYHVAAPDWYDGLRFRIRKVGDERAVIAQVRAQSVPSDECVEAPLDLYGRPDGGQCTESAQCLGGDCATLQVLGIYEVQTCGSCDGAAGCGREACGQEYGEPELPFLACGAPGRHALGEACQFDGECATGVCCGGQCSECCGAGTCAGGEACDERPPEDPETDRGLMPHMCDAAAGLRAVGESCLGDDDCASGDCDDRLGSLRICDSTGRPCSADEECGLWGFGGACRRVGVLEGVCR